MDKSPGTIVIRRGQADSAESDIYTKALGDHLDTLPDFQSLKGPKMGGPDSPRPSTLPPGPVFLYAEEEGAAHAGRSHVVGSLRLMRLHTASPMFRGLPENVRTAGEIKRMVVFPRV